MLYVDDYAIVRCVLILFTPFPLITPCGASYRPGGMARCRPPACGQEGPPGDADLSNAAVT